MNSALGLLRISLLSATAVVGQFTLRAAPVDFAREVLPILSDACFHCHGPDANKGQKAGLRLDIKEGLFRTKDGITAVKPGDSLGSALIQRIQSHDSDEIMPPPEAVRQLTSEEVKTLERWVAEGAPWSQHWAFEPMKHVTPARQGPAAIDQLIEEKLAEQQLGHLSPEASRERLLRRVTLDLTGLPPTPEQRAAFLADASELAYEKVVDRLLASPLYGERMATEWLDAARFADTHGFQADAPRDMSPWRDWVIQAFNDNLPYDQFVTWQLAGDLLPQPTKEQRIATAFNRLHSQNEEGGIVAEEFRIQYNVDRVNTFGTVFLGMTLECTRCHDHKYDPLSAKDYYALLAFFQNIDEAGQIPYNGAVRDMPVPAMLLTTTAQDQKLAELQTTIHTKEQALTSIRQGATIRFNDWLTSRPTQPNIPGLVARYAFNEMDGKSSPNSVANQKPAEKRESPLLVAGVHGQAVQLDGDNGFTFPEAGKFSRSEPFTLSLWIRPGTPAPSQVVLHRTRWGADAAHRGYELSLEQGMPSFALTYYAPENAIKVKLQKSLPAGAWSHVTITYDGSSRASGVRFYVNGKVEALATERDSLTKDIESGAALALGWRDRDVGFKDGSVDEFRIYSRELTSLEAKQLANLPDWQTHWSLPTDRLNPALREDLLSYYLHTVDPTYQKALHELQQARLEQSKFIQPIQELMVMRELPQPKKAYILNRGAYDSPGEEVHADTPQVMPPFSSNAPRNRLGLAHWLLDPEHPLMARVTVNRFWQMLFGRGLVSSADNFGRQGALPTHPELLDWLARDFIQSGWDVKAFLRQIVLSKTYRQSSLPTALATQKDGGNLWLSHAPSRRLTAEMLRDQALADSGLLSPKLGGPSVYPYQPANLWEIAMGKPAYPQSKGDALYRRTLYSFIKRTVAPPAAASLDAADRSYCTVQRQSTSTPLQALVLLNDTQIIEAARHVALRILKEGGQSSKEQLSWGFQLITSRSPTQKETSILHQLFTEQLALFEQNPEEATLLLQVGDSSPTKGHSITVIAAMTIVAKALLNTDEALMRR